MTRAILALAFLFPSVGWAGVCTEAAPTDTPCTGRVIPAADALAALSCLRVDLPSAVADLRASEARRAAEGDALRSMLEAERVARGEVEAALVDASEVPAAASPYLWGAVGLAVGVAVGVLAAVYLVK